MVHSNHPLLFIISLPFLRSSTKLVHLFRALNDLILQDGLGMFHSLIFLLLVQVERFDILWKPMPRICTNYYKTRITIPIKNSVGNKVVLYISHCIFMKKLHLSVNTSTDHFQKITLRFVEFVCTCS